MHDDVVSAKSLSMKMRWLLANRIGLQQQRQVVLSCCIHRHSRNSHEIRLVDFVRGLKWLITYNLYRVWLIKVDRSMIVTISGHDINAAAAFSVLLRDFIELRVRCLLQSFAVTWNITNEKWFHLYIASTRSKCKQMMYQSEESVCGNTHISWSQFDSLFFFSFHLRRSTTVVSWIRRKSVNFSFIFFCTSTCGVANKFCSPVNYIRCNYTYFMRSIVMGF